MTTTATKRAAFAPGQTFSTLVKHRDFRFLWFSNLFYQIGMWMQTLVMGWLAYELTKSVFLAAMFAAARLAPQLLGPFTGTIADRVNRRQVLIGAQVLQIVLGSGMAFLAQTGRLSFGPLLAGGFVGGLVWVFTNNSASTTAMDIVGPQDISNAIALNTVAYDITRVVGPALGGILLGVLGAPSCFWIVAALGVPSLLALSQLRTPPRKLSGASPLQNLVEGFRFVIHSRDLLSVLSISFAANIFLWPAYQSFMSIFAKDNLHLTSTGLGFLQTSCGVGALIGALVIAALGNFRGKGQMFLWGTGLYAVAFGFFALARAYTPALILIGLAGVGSSAFSAMQSTLTLLLAPVEMRARCLGFLQMAIGVLPFGCLALGAIADNIGVGLTTAVSCGLLVLVLVAIGVWLPNLRRL